VGSINKKITVQAHETKIGDPIPKITKAKEAGPLAQVIEGPAWQTEALSSNPIQMNGLYLVVSATEGKRKYALVSFD
jgi:hypothetical protein